MSSSGVSGGAPGPWRVSGRVVLDASGAPVFRGWRVEKVGLTGRRFSVLADDGSAWSVRTIGVTVAQLLVEGPGGVLSLNRRAGSRDRDVVFLGDRPGSVDSSAESGFRASERRFVGRTRVRRGKLVLEIVGGSPDAAGVDGRLLAAACAVCGHVDASRDLRGTLRG